MMNSDEIFDSVEDIFDFDVDDGYQTDTDDVVEDDAAESETTAEATDDDAEESDQEPQGESDDADADDDEHAGESEKNGAEDKEKSADGADSEQVFTLKVNKEERKVTLEEMTTLAQKGADYDRVKSQLETSRQNEQALQVKLNENSGILDVLTLISEQTKTPMDKLVDQLYVNLQKGNGKSETEARQDLENARLRKENNALKTKQQEEKAEAENIAARAQRDIAEFRKHFPDVHLTQELCDKLTPDIQAGMSLTNAYLKMENAQLKAEAEQRKQQEAAASQNKKNRSRTPGSMRDSGGGRTTDLADIFEKELFK